MSDLKFDFYKNKIDNRRPVDTSQQIQSLVRESTRQESNRQNKVNSSSFHSSSENSVKMPRSRSNSPIRSNSPNRNNSSVRKSTPILPNKASNNALSKKINLDTMLWSSIME